MELSIEPNVRDAWLNIHEVLKGDDAMIEWLSGYLTHWTDLDPNNTPVSDARALKGLTTHEGLNLDFTQMNDVSTLSGL